MRLIVLSFGIVVVAACHAADVPPDADEALACMTSGRGDIYSVGLERMGKRGLLDFKLISADPAPPGRFLNTWVIQINSMSSGVVGAPASNATMTVMPYMPDHQHGAGAYTVQVLGMGAGQYKLTQIYMYMPGYWEVTIDAQAGAGSDSVVYKFCIQA